MLLAAIETGFDRLSSGLGPKDPYWRMATLELARYTAEAVRIVEQREPTLDQLEHLGERRRRLDDLLARAGALDDTDLKRCRWFCEYWLGLSPRLRDAIAVSMQLACSNASAHDLIPHRRPAELWL